MPNYQPYYSPPRHQPSFKKSAPRRGSFKRSLWLIFAIFLLLAAVHIDLARRAAAKAALAAETAKHDAAITALSQKIGNITAAEPQVNFYVSLSDSRTAKTINYNAATSTDAASTAKVLSALVFLNQVQHGQQTLQEPVGGVSAKQALQLMINRSDDTMWADFNDLLGHETLQTYAENLGLSSYDAETNEISAADMNSLIKKLSDGDLLNQNYTSLLLGYMTNTNYEDFITPAVVNSAQIYHKVGLDGDEVNDTAIIKTSDDTLYITIFTDGNGYYNWDQRAGLMQQITKAAEQAYFD